jgi:hypothetical protein
VEVSSLEAAFAQSLVAMRLGLAAPRFRNLALSLDATRGPHTTESDDAFAVAAGPAIARRHPSPRVADSDVLNQC